MFEKSAFLGRRCFKLCLYCVTRTLVIFCCERGMRLEMFLFRKDSSEVIWEIVYMLKLGCNLVMFVFLFLL